MLLPNPLPVKPPEPTAIKGEQFINAVVYKNKKTGEEKELPVGGLFVEIGAVPTTDFVKSIVDLNEHGAIKIDPWTQQTSEKGIWAAGDCTNVLYHQNIDQILQKKHTMLLLHPCLGI